MRAQRNVEKPGTTIFFFLGAGQPVLRVFFSPSGYGCHGARPHIPPAGQRSSCMSISTRSIDGSKIDWPLRVALEASRLHAAVKSEPVCGDHSAHRRDRRAFQSQALREIPHWWIFSECTLNRQDKRGAPRVRGLTNKQRGAHNCHVAVAVAVDLSSQCHVAVIPVPGAVPC